MIRRKSPLRTRKPSVAQSLKIVGKKIVQSAPHPKDYKTKSGQRKRGH
ncbi:MAG TPA: hypothetical protein VJG83_04485 [archaeon]|nr:hypothetical protein [archaeon]